MLTSSISIATIYITYALQAFQRKKRKYIFLTNLIYLLLKFTLQFLQVEKQKNVFVMS